MDKRTTHLEVTSTQFIYSCSCSYSCRWDRYGSRADPEKASVSIMYRASNHVCGAISHFTDPGRSFEDLGTIKELPVSAGENPT